MWNMSEGERTGHALAHYATVRAIHQDRMPLVDAAGNLRVPPRAKDGRGAGVRVHPGEVIRRQWEAAFGVVYGLDVVQEEGALGLVETPLELTTEDEGAELEPTRERP